MPHPGPGEVCLEVEAFGLNRSESQMRQGSYPMLNASFPSRVGKEAVGKVTAIGEGVEGIHLGQRYTTVPCFDMNKHGVYGEVAVVPAMALAAVPRGFSAEQATAIWQQYLTAYGPLVEYSQLAPGKTVLVTAATASVGHACIQIAKALGATVIATTRQKEKVPRLVETGADHVVVTSSEALVERVLALTSGKGADVIVDSISGPIVADLAECAAYRGEALPVRTTRPDTDPVSADHLPEEGSVDQRLHPLGNRARSVAASAGRRLDHRATGERCFCAGHRPRVCAGRHRRGACLHGRQPGQWQTRCSRSGMRVPPTQRWFDEFSAGEVFEFDGLSDRRTLGRRLGPPL